MCCTEEKGKTLFYIVTEEIEKKTKQKTKEACVYVGKKRRRRKNSDKVNTTKENVIIKEKTGKTQATKRTKV